MRPLASPVLLFFLMLLTATHGAGAYDVSDVRLTWYEHEVRAIAPNVELPGVIVNLTLSADFQRCWDERPLPACALVLDTDGLAAIDGYRLDVRERCRNESGAIRCATPAATLRTGNGTIRIAYFGQAGTQRGITGTRTVALTLDNTTPQVQSIRTGACFDNATTCYIAANVPSPIIITFNDARTSFDWRLVFIGRDGSTSLARAGNCSGNVCVANLITPCQDGQEFRLALTSAGGVSSREDAQNTVAPYPGTRVVCKTQGPRISDVNISADGIAGQAVSGGSLRVTARVTGGVGEVTSVIETHGLLGENSTNQTSPGSCMATNASSDARDCVWQLSPLAGGTFTIDIKATDALGLYSGAQSHVTVLQLVGGSPNASVDVYFSNVVQVSPKELNRMALDLARTNHLPYPMYVTYQLTPRKPDARVYRQELTSCVYRMPNETNWTANYNLFGFGGSDIESRVLDPTANHSVANRLDLAIRALPQVLGQSDVFLANCTVRLTVGDGTSLYQDPENESVAFEVHLRETVLGQPGQEFIKKIKREEDKLSGSDQKLLTNLREIRATLDGVCSVMDSLSTLSTTGAGVEGLGAAVASTGYGIVPGNTLAHLGGGLHNGIKEVLDQVWVNPDEQNQGVLVAQGSSAGSWSGEAGAAIKAMNDPGARFMKKMCAQVNCRYAVQTKDQQLFTGGSAWAGVGNDVMANMNAPDPSESFVTSALQLCVGGMIYNAGKVQDIDCGYLLCLKEQSLNGLSTAVCEQARDHKVCTLVVGEVFELPGPLRVAKNIAQNANKILSNFPAYVLKSVVVNNVCKPYYSSAATGAGPQWAVVACHLTRSIVDVIDFQNQASQGFATPMRDSDVCLQAKCSDDDRAAGKCKTSFNRVEQYQKYTDYLSLNAWLRDKKATQQPAKGGKSVAQLEYEAAKREYCPTTGSCDITFREGKDPKTVYEVHYQISGGEGTEAIQTFAIRAEADAYLAQLQDAQASSAPYLNAHIEPVTITSYDVWTTNGEQHSGVSDHFSRELEDIDPSVRDDPRFLAALGDGIVLRSQGDLDMYQRAIDAQVFAKDDKTRKDQANLFVQYEACADDACRAKAADELQSAYNIRITKGADGKPWANFIGGTINVPPEYLSGCQRDSICSPTHEENGVMVGNPDVYLDKDGIPHSVTAMPTKDAADAGKFAKKVEYWNTFDFIANIAVKWAYDKGYLDWLSTSYWGDWGRDVSEWSNSHLTKEGWANNICNEAVFDINDNDDGAIYTARAGGDVKPVGMFAAEVREWPEGPKEKRYVYLIAIGIENPIRPAPHGVSDADWTVANSFTLDAFMDGADGKRDIINGTFDLKFGTSFGTGHIPKQALIYSPVKYTRICVAFDKQFPDASGKRGYCRDIAQNVFARGSPGAPGATPPAPGGSGSLDGEIA